MSRLNIFGGQGEVNDALDLHLGGPTGLAAASPLRGGDNKGTFSVSSSMAEGEVTIVESAVSGMTVDSPETTSGDVDEFRLRMNKIEPNRCLFVNNDRTRSTFCYGIIGGSGEKFCMKRIDPGSRHCGTAAHEKKIQTLKNHHLYYRDYAKQCGYVSPEFEGSHPMAATLYSLKDDLLHRLHFKEIIEMIEHRDVTDMESLIDARARVLKSDLGVSFTPRKKPRFSAGGDESWFAPGADSMPTISEIPNPDENPLGPDVDSHIAANWPAVVSTVSILKSQFSKSEKYEDEISKLGEELDALSASVARLQTLLGAPADGSRFNLFETVDDLEAVVLELDAKVESVRKGVGSTGAPMDIGQLEGRMNSLEGTMDRLSKVDLMNLTRRIGEVEKSSAGMDRKPAAVEHKSKVGEIPGLEGTPSNARLHQVLTVQVIPAIRELWTLYTLLTLGPGKSGLSLGSGLASGQALFKGLEAIEKYIANFELKTTSATAEVENRIQALEKDIAQLKSGMNNPGSSGMQQAASGGLFPNMFGGQSTWTTGGGGSGSIGGWSGGFGSLTGNAGNVAAGGQGGAGVTNQGIDARIATLETQLQDLEAQLNNSTVRLGDNVFKSQDDCEVFVQANVPRCTYEQFFDMISLLQRAWGQNHKGLSQSWEDTYNRSRAGFKSKNEAIISASLETVIPTALGEFTGKTTEAVKPLTGVPTRRHWENNGGLSGKRHDIAECLLKLQPTLDTQQKLLFIRHPVGASVARELLSKSKTHWTQFESMMDKFYEEFARYSTNDEAWELSCLIGKTVLEIIYQERAIAADLTDMMTDAQKGGRVLWATLQAHRVFDEFAALTYRNHPRLSPIIVLHLLQNRISKTEFDTLKSESKSQQKAIDRLTTAIEGLKRKS